MSFQGYDQDQELGAPVDLFQFVMSPTLSYFYCSADADLTIGGVVYKAVPVQRQTIKTSGKFEKTNLEIRVPVTTDLAGIFLPYPPPNVVRVIVRQVHLTDPDLQALAVWAGRVISSARANHEAVLTCDSTVLSFKRPGLNRFYQHGCGLLLYGSLCRADKGSHQVTFKPVSITDDALLIFPANWWLPWTHANFRGGTIEWTSSLGTETRTIIASEEAYIKVGGPLRDVTTDTELTLALGCAHDMDDCRNVFNNILNYGGQPWIPFKNPTKQHPFW
jgi:hypothetical protein